MSTPTKSNRPWWASARRKGGMRSTYEHTLKTDMENRGLPFEYEPSDGHLSYMLSYKPDFRLPNGILVEAKGYFDSTDRTKMLRVKKANPEADIRFIFKSNNKINPRSKNRYTDWCQKHGFKCHVGKSIPKEWWDEGEPVIPEGVKGIPLVQKAIKRRKKA
jgi:hypothetical protein